MNLDFITNKTVSTIKDPFNKASFEGLSMRAYKGIMGNYIIYGRVEFKNGNTIGEQRIDADTFEELTIKMKSFLDELK